jgi:futalosine hydrolase
MFVIVVPTEMEALRLIDSPCNLAFGEPHLATIGDSKVQFAVCGFGMAAAGVGVCRTLHSLPPVEGVILAGTAGTLVGRSAPIGAVVVGRTVRCVDLGIPAVEEDRLTVAVPRLSSWADQLDLRVLPTLKDFPTGEILSVAGPATSLEFAESRRIRYPAGLIEEMEGYSVAVACHTWNIPLTIIRGVSNEAGDRDKSNWKFFDAMDAVKRAIQIAVAG